MSRLPSCSEVLAGWLLGRFGVTLVMRKHIQVVLYVTEAEMWSRGGNWGSVVGGLRAETETLGQICCSSSETGPGETKH